MHFNSSQVSTQLTTFLRSNVQPIRYFSQQTGKSNGSLCAIYDTEIIRQILISKIRTHRSTTLQRFIPKWKMHLKEIKMLKQHPTSVG